VKKIKSKILGLNDTIKNNNENIDYKILTLDKLDKYIS
jgi:hypothetical protein